MPRKSFFEYLASLLKHLETAKHGVGLPSWKHHLDKVAKPGRRYSIRGAPHVTSLVIWQKCVLKQTSLLGWRCHLQALIVHLASGVSCHSACMQENERRQEQETCRGDAS
jgi:hypothetical protein